MTRMFPHTSASNDCRIHTRQILPVPSSTRSYWRSEPHALDQYRSTPELPRQCDILIIGAGMSGVVLAYQLLKEYSHVPQPSILLLEAREVCSGATGRNGGHSKVQTMNVQRFKRKFGVEFAEEMAAFFDEQTFALKEIVETEQLECEFEMRRSFDVFLDEHEARVAAQDFRESTRNGELWARQIGFVPKQRAEQITSIRDTQCAFSDPACSLWPYKFVTELLAKIIDQINLQTETMVTDVAVADDGRNIVQTSRGLVVAAKVAFASNAYTGGICPGYVGHIVPYKGVNSHLLPHPGPVFPHLNQTYNICYGPGKVDYLNPRPDGGIVVGGGKWNFEHHEELWYNNWDDSTLLPNVVEHFDQLMQRHFKGWEQSGSSLNSLWTGIMGATADGLPHVGRVVDQNSQFIMAGFNGGGMSMIVLIAKGLAKMIAHDINFSETGLPTRFETSAERLEIKLGRPFRRT